MGRRRSTSWREAPPDAIVLDVLMPGIDGLEVCRRLRAAGDRTPVLMLTARDAVDDRVAGSTPAPTTTSSSRSRCDELMARAAGAAAAHRPGRRRRAELRRPGLDPATPRCAAASARSS